MKWADAMGIKVAGIASVDTNKPNEKRNWSRKTKQNKKRKTKDMKKNKHKTDPANADAGEQAHYPARTLAFRLAHPK